MNRTFIALGGAAAAIVVGVLAIGLYFNQPGFGGPPGATPSPTLPFTASPAPTPPFTASPPPTETPRSDPDGVLAPGTYAAHPLPAPNDSLTLTFTVPEGWVGDAADLVPADEPGVEPPGGMFIQFIDVTTLNGDPCDWLGQADDVSVGPAVDDLVEALGAQTAYEVSDAIDVRIGGYSGKRVDIVHPTEPFAGETSTAPECDEGNFRLWSTTAHGIYPLYAQGPANRWQTNILDVDGTRLVIVVADFPGTLPDDRAEMDAIIDSIAIEP